MARKKSAKSQPAARPALKPQPAPPQPSLAGPPDAWDVRAKIAADKLAGPEEIERVDDSWYDAHRDLYNQWDLMRDRYDEAEESCARLRAVGRNIEALMDAVVELLDHMEHAPLDTIYPTVLNVLKDQIRRELDSCTRTED